MVWRPEVGIRCLSESFSNLGFTDLGRVAGQQTQGVSCLCLPSVEITDPHCGTPLFLRQKWVLGLTLRPQCLFKSSPIKPPLLLSISAFFKDFANEGQVESGLKPIIKLKYF